MEKVVVYSGTRNCYDDIKTAMKSLLYNNQDISRVYIIAEDDAMPYKIPDFCRVVNVSGQTYFKTNGPNYKCHWTYMALIKAALTKVLPDEDLVLYLDIDTIVEDDISDLWKQNMTDAYIAGVREVHRSGPEFTYLNAGVMLLNLKNLRADGIDKKIVDELNNTWHYTPEQDCYNIFCQGHLLELDPGYNATTFMPKPEHLYIRHHAGLSPGVFRRKPDVVKYRRMEEIW